MISDRPPSNRFINKRTCELRFHSVTIRRSKYSSKVSVMSIIPSFFTGRRSNVFDPFSLDIWDPFQGFSSVLNNLPESSRETAAITNARIDWKETPEAHVFKADIPGLKKEEVKVEVEEGRVLQISGERSKEHEEKNDRWHRVERSSGKFLRRFRLPENTKMEEVKATMENGVLTVTVPKAEEKKPEVKSIDIGG
ncbi:17.8 kDa class I heat shock protein [Lactuca sativa]|uniref:17.8 kDa class I heat shock protein n=2 Tax=Lactuca sativa TaxID=4236 RepID=UPI000CD9D003|nr:17.8 kDa class I heat shock protein [Lactuca sativa]XP_023740839.1 17.8 kDa class I heat shock protein [Lactuca sativa]